MFFLEIKINLPHAFVIRFSTSPTVNHGNLYGFFFLPAAAGKNAAGRKEKGEEKGNFSE